MTSSAAIAEPRPRYAVTVPHEVAVWDLWEASVKKGLSVPSSSGEALRVMSPGRRGTGPGPDFRDAVLKTRNGKFLVGDVEVHRLPGGWKGHGHDRDSRYNNVVLHVVFRGGGAAALELGIEAPTVALEGMEIPVQSTNERRIFPCHDAIPRLGKARIEEVLGRAGETRFQSKAARLRLRSAYVLPEEVLYAGLMEALGYSANREPFRRLALSLPHAWLRKQALGLPGRDREPWLERALVGASGLEGSTVNGSGVPPLLQASDWKVGGLRPANQPRRRLQGAALLLHRWLPIGLEAGLEPTVRAGDAMGLVDALVGRPPMAQRWSGGAGHWTLLPTSSCPISGLLQYGAGTGPWPGEPLRLLQRCQVLRRTK